MGNARILVVDSDPESSQNLKELLEASGYEVPAVVPSKKECVKKIGQLKPDLIIIDSFLRGADDENDGAGSIAPNYDIPIIYYADLPGDGIPARDETLPAYGLIFKPVTKNELRIAVEFALYQREMEEVLRRSEEQKHVEENLRVAHKQLRDIIDFLPDAAVVIDKEKKIIAWNRAMEKMTGYPQGSMIGKGDYEYAIPFYGKRRPVLIDLDRVESSEYAGMYKKLFKIDDTLYAETYISSLPATGKEVYLWVNASPLYDDEHNIIGAIETVRDITAVKQIEMALRDSEEKFRLLFDQSSNAQALYDYEEKIIVDCNMAMMKLLGFAQKNDICGKHPVELSPESQPDGTSSVERIQEIIDQAYGQGSLSTEWTHRHFNGMEIPVDITLTVIPIAGKKIIHALMQDITGRKRLEREVLEVSIKEQRRIGRDLHDDIGQILTGTGFLCESLVKKLTNYSIPEAADARAIFNLINEAKEHARLLSRGLSPVEIDSGGIAAALERFITSVESIYSVSCTLSIDPRLDIHDSMVETQFHYIVQESINNAIKHGNAKKIIVTLHMRDDHVELIISDDGIGIPDDIGSARGMGLRIMKYRAQAIGASIKIDKRKGGGTVVACQWLQR